MVSLKIFLRLALLFSLSRVVSLRIVVASTSSPPSLPAQADRRALPTAPSVTMRPVIPLLLPALAAAQSSVSIVITNGVTTTVVLPAWPSVTNFLTSPTSTVTTTTTIPTTTTTVYVQPGGPESSASDTSTSISSTTTTTISTSLTLTVTASTVPSSTSTTTAVVTSTSTASVSSVSATSTAIINTSTFAPGPTFSTTLTSFSTSVTTTANATTTKPAATVTTSPATVPTAAAGELVADGSLMGLVLFCVMGYFIL
ncbi:hypothetical protein BR93DRAFT_633023 [Coniochaeta sp. PMI_546]|nr:hypothetical protein BR93DRAFT_633023 [Coniochaeta sp. PMI_546]